MLRPHHTIQEHSEPFPLVPFKLLSRLQRWDLATDQPESAEAQPVVWDPAEQEWTFDLSVAAVTVYGDFWRGFGFEDDLIRAYEDPHSGRWMAVGAGHFWVRGKIGNLGGGGPDELVESGTCNFNIWEWLRDPEDEEAGAFDWRVSDPLKTIVIREAIGLDDPLPSKSLLFATWHEQGQFWIASQSPCIA